MIKRVLATVLCAYHQLIDLTDSYHFILQIPNFHFGVDIT